MTTNEPRLIDGHAAAALLSLNPRRSALQLWLEMAEETPLETAAQRREYDLCLAPFVAARIRTSYGGNVLAEPYEKAAPKTWSCCRDVMRYVDCGEEEDAGLYHLIDLRGTDYAAPELWRNDNPEGLYMQNIWNLGADGKALSAIAPVCIAHDPCLFRTVEIKPNPQLFGEMLRRATLFLHSVDKGIPPQPKGGDCAHLGHLFNPKEGAFLALPERDYQEMIIEYLKVPKAEEKATREIAHMRLRREEIKAILLRAMESAEYATCDTYVLHNLGGGNLAVGINRES